MQLFTRKWRKLAAGSAAAGCRHRIQTSHQFKSAQGVQRQQVRTGGPTQLPARTASHIAPASDLTLSLASSNFRNRKCY